MTSSNVQAGSHAQLWRIEQIEGIYESESVAAGHCRLALEGWREETEWEPHWEEGREGVREGEREIEALRDRGKKSWSESTKRKGGSCGMEEEREAGGEGGREGGSEGRRGGRNGGRGGREGGRESGREGGRVGGRTLIAAAPSTSSTSPPATHA